MDEHPVNRALGKPEDNRWKLRAIASWQREPSQGGNRLKCPENHITLTLLNGVLVGSRDRGLVVLECPLCGYVHPHVPVAVYDNYREVRRQVNEGIGAHRQGR